MIYFIIYALFFPVLLILSLFRKKSGGILIIQTAKIGDYANSSIIFEVVKKFDIVLDRVNLNFADFDDRIIHKFEINSVKKSFFQKIILAFKLYFMNYSCVYVMMPNALNLFLAKFSFAKKIVTIEHEFCGFSFKLLSLNMQKIRHNRSNLTLLTYLKMVGINPNFTNLNGEKSLNLNYKKIIQNPIFIPQNPKINSDKFKVGISLTAGNRIKTPPARTWNKIFKILGELDCEIYIFGVNDEIKLLENIDTKGINVVSMIDKIKLFELPFHISKMNLYISSDTGNYYIADALSVPTICLMGPCFASEQRGVFCSLIINSNLKPISSVFQTIRNIDASEYFNLTIDDENMIKDFIKSIKNGRF